MKIKNLPRRHETAGTPYIKGAGATAMASTDYAPFDRSSLLEEYYPLVKSVVRNMMVHLPSCADAEELESVGVFGLIAAVDKYDEGQKKTFRGYAAVRIRGAILDELRRIDTLPRTRRAKVRHLQETVEELEQKLGRVPTDKELAKKMDMTLPQLRRYQSKAQPVVTFSLDGSTNEEGEPTNLHEAIADESNLPCIEKMEKQEFIEEMLHSFADLPERQQEVLRLYYYEDKRLADIARVFGVSEARVCQIHNQALKRLRKSFNAVEA